MSELTDRLNAIQKRKDAVTPGAWTAWDRGIGYEVHGVDGMPINDNHRETFVRGDAEFIADAPSDVAFLLDLARKQQAALAAVLDWCDTNQYPWHPSEGVEGVFSSQDWALDDAARRVRTAITEALGGT